MSRLKQVTLSGYKLDGWQWDDGPVFVGEDGRKWAIIWGKTCLYREELNNLATLLVRHEQTKSNIETLKALQAKKEMLDDS